MGKSECSYYQKNIAPGEARTHGLQIMRLTRCLLRYRGLCIRTENFRYLTSFLGSHPKSASSIPRLPPLNRAVSLATGMSQIADPREEKMNEMERIIQSYQEKLDTVTTNYQVSKL